MQFVWTPANNSLGPSVNIFTHVFDDIYRAPIGFNFDIRYDPWDPQWINDPELKGYNAPEEAEKLM